MRRSRTLRRRRSSRKIVRHRQRRSLRSRKQRGGAGPAGQNASQPPFEKAYIITMDESADRYKKVKAMADAAGIPLTKWPGVKIDPTDTQKIQSLPTLGIGSTQFVDRKSVLRNLGVIGCFLAHRGLLEHIAKTGDPSKATLIFEDDITIQPNLLQGYEAVRHEIPDDWDYIFLNKGHLVGDKISEHIVKLKRAPAIQTNDGFWGFLVKNSSIQERILPRLKYMIDNVDLQINLYADELNLYLIQPPLIWFSEDSKNSIIARN